MTGREALKAIAEQALVWSELPVAWRRIRRRGVLALAYHNVVPAGGAVGGDRSLHLSATEFAAQLDMVMETHEVVSLDAVLNGASRAGRRPRAVITFDDAYQGAVTVGVGELVRRRLPATIFVAPAFVGGRFFWWDALTEAETPQLLAAFRDHALEACRGADAAVREWADRSGVRTRTLPDAVGCASEDELRAAFSHPGITPGSHSWSHPNLPRLTRAELGEELRRALAWLRGRFARVLPVLAYPYGLSSPLVESAAAAAGYQAGMLVNGGWMPPRPRNPFALPRFNVPAGLSRNGFLIRTAGLFCR